MCVLRPLCSDLCLPASAGNYYEYSVSDPVAAGLILFVCLPALLSVTQRDGEFNRKKKFHGEVCGYRAVGWTSSVAS